MPNVFSPHRQRIKLPAQCDGFPEQSLAGVGPGGMKGIDTELEIPQEMGEAELMTPMRDHHKVGSQSITHPGGSRKKCTQKSFDDLVPSGSIDMEKCGEGIAEYPELCPRPRYSCPRLVALDGRAVSHFFLDFLIPRGDVIRHTMNERTERALAQGQVTEIL